MTKKDFNKKDKKGREETWEWEETPEVTEAIKQLHLTTANFKLNKPHPYNNEKTTANS